MLKPTHRNMLIVGMILFIVFSAVSLTISEAKPPTIDNASPFTGYEKPTGNNFINPGGSANNGLQYNGDFSVKPKPLPIVPLVNPVVDDKNKNHNQGSGNNNQIPDDHNQGSGNNNQIPDDHNKGPKPGEKYDWNQYWNHGQNQQFTSTSTSISYYYSYWPTSMTPKWYLNWNYAPSTPVFVLGILSSSSYPSWATVVIYNPSASATPYPNWSVKVNGIVYLYPSNVNIAAGGYCEIMVPVHAGLNTIEILNGNSDVIPSTPWQDSLMMGSDGNPYRASQTVEEFNLGLSQTITV